MTRLVIGLLAVVALALFASTYLSDPEKMQSGFVRDISENVTIDEKLIFVPYWTLDSSADLAQYDTLIYFGIAGDENGVIVDAGSANVDTFYTKTSPHHKTLLTVRLVDHDTNSKILESKEAQKEIIEGSISFAKEHNFDGIVMDFETKSLGFEEVTAETTLFLTQAASRIQNRGLEAHTLLFGDTYYRARAFDVEKIAHASDSVMIMAYDFHKSGGGVPGPTFPTYGKEIYGYDFVSMLDEFTKDAPQEKITIILGMFGYDWDEDGKSTSITTNEATQKFLPECAFTNCIVTQDAQSEEMKVKYESEGRHEVWVETEKSAEIKIQEMEKRGISKVGYWAYSFF